MILGRRVLVAPVGGELGHRIQAWRLVYDPRYAAVMPPHLTLCYQPTAAPCELIEAQARHAFRTPITVALGEVGELGNRDCTLCIGVLDTRELDEARDRLFDGTYVQLEGHRTWRWHITCVRNGKARDRAVLMAHASDAIAASGAVLRIETIELMERGPLRYEAIARWRLGE